MSLLGEQETQLKVPLQQLAIGRDDGLINIAANHYFNPIGRFCKLSCFGIQRRPELHRQVQNTSLRAAKQRDVEGFQHIKSTALFVDLYKNFVGLDHAKFAARFFLNNFKTFFQVTHFCSQLVVGLLHLEIA